MSSRSFSALGAPLLALLLATAAWSEPAVSAASPLSAHSSTQQVQGALVDLRYGQVSIDRGGQATVLELEDRSKIWLDGRAVSPQELLAGVPRGLGAVATFRGASGTIEKLEAFSSGQGQARTDLLLLPREAPAYRQGGLLTLLLSPAEADRLGGGPLTLLAPGLAHVAFTPAQRGGLKAYLRLQPTRNLIEIPLFVQGKDRLYRGPSISISASTPKLTSHGPARASSSLATIPGWVDIEHPPSLLDISSAQLRLSPGLRVVRFQPRVDRAVFELQADGPGEHWVEFEIADVFGQLARQRWGLQVRP